MSLKPCPCALNPHLVVSCTPDICALSPCHLAFLHLADLYETRREVGMDIERRRDTIHLYGVDVMSTDDVYKYFEEYGPTFVEWINDSSCERSHVDGEQGRGVGRCSLRLAFSGPEAPPVFATCTCRSTCSTTIKELEQLVIVL